MRFLVRLSLNAPRRMLLVMLLITAAVSSGALFLRFDFSPEQVYGGQTAAVEFCEQHKQLFRFEDSVALVLLEATGETTVLDPAVLDWVDQLSQRARDIPGVVDVTSLTTLETPRLNRAEGNLHWVPLLPKHLRENPAFVQQQLSRLPLLNDLLISQDRQLTLVLIALDPGGRDISSTRPRVEALQQLLQQLKTPAGTQVSLSGVPAIRVDVIQSLLTDQLVMTPISGALFIVIALFMYRSWQVTAASLLAVVCAVGLTVGLMGWSGMTFSILSNVVPTLIMIIGAANCVHIIGRLQVVLRTHTGSLSDAVRAVMLEMSRTCLLTLATTAIGFGSLLLARSDLLQQLALQSVLGMVCNYVSLMLVLGPGLLLTAHTMAVPERCTDRRPGPPFRRWLNWGAVGQGIVRFSWPLVLLHLVIAVLAVAASASMRVNSYMFETYDSEHPMVQVSRTLDERMSGLITLEVQLQTKDASRYLDDDVLTACQRIRSALRTDDRISFTRDYAELLAAFDKRLLSDERDQREAAVGRIQRTLQRLKRPELVQPFLAQDENKARLMLRVRDIGSAGLHELFVVVREVLDRELPTDVSYRLTGDAWLHAVCMDRFVRDLFYSLIAASGVIFVLIGILFRSVRTGLISSVPNLFPLTMTLGYMYCRNYELTAGNVIVFAISLGIAVDDTIHFLARYRDESKRQSDCGAAISAALQSSGRAIVLTSLLVVSGLSVLVFSDFLPTRRFAELTAVTMCAALPGDVVLLPAMLSLLAKRRT